NLPRLLTDYFTIVPDVDNHDQLVAFGTSGHRGTPGRGSFTDSHILAIAQAICDYRREAGIGGPLYLGMDTHALSEAAHATTVCVLAANGVQVRLAAGRGYTPTPVISHAILADNRGLDRRDLSRAADGIVITPSHNPPEDGGIKYNPPHGGPADTDVTQWIAERANRLLRDGNRAVRRLPLAAALACPQVREHDYIGPYVADLEQVIDFEVIRAAGIRLGADALGGAGLGYWRPIAERYGLDVTIHHAHPDATFRFMRLDHDGRIRMDCSSPQAMAGLIRLKDDYDIAFGNDPDFDRHGIVTPSAGLMNPNHYLAVAIDYLCRHRPQWPSAAGIGKTVVSSCLIDRVAASHGRRLVEVPVGFKWFVSGLLDGALAFGGEESAGASFLRRDGTVWSTDKDGVILSLLAAEITARTGADPAAYYRGLEQAYGTFWYARQDTPATSAQKAALEKMLPEDIGLDNLGGDPITSVLTQAPGNGAPIGGLKLCTDSGWVAVRPSGTEEVCKVYAESRRSQSHLRKLQQEGAALLSRA
ncbi:MAG: phosphoglucomutase (alpha-D-glucose-1,6-bisphosphate-dependent), partial [Lentisphaeria bacterium]|nr:phosphoglucomutase (alpha-D-glucose-1,6-bisphosphate-dependent) [Lentisphaeria bacterium]